MSLQVRGGLLVMNSASYLGQMQNWKIKTESNQHLLSIYYIQSLVQSHRTDCFRFLSTEKERTTPFSKP